MRRKKEQHLELAKKFDQLVSSGLSNTEAIDQLGMSHSGFYSRVYQYVSKNNKKRPNSFDQKKPKKNKTLHETIVLPQQRKNTFVIITDIENLKQALKELM